MTKCACIYKVIREQKFDDHTFLRMMEKVEPTCQHCLAVAAEQTEQDARHKAYIADPANHQPLDCDTCGQFICMHIPNDLEGSNFFCNTCSPKPSIT